MTVLLFIALFVIGLAFLGLGFGGGKPDRDARPEDYCGGASN